MSNRQGTPDERLAQARRKLMAAGVGLVVGLVVGTPLLYGMLWLLEIIGLGVPAREVSVLGQSGMPSLGFTLAVTGLLGMNIGLWLAMKDNPQAKPETRRLINRWVILLMCTLPITLIYNPQLSYLLSGTVVPEWGRELPLILARGVLAGAVFGLAVQYVTELLLSRLKQREG